MKNKKIYVVGLGYIGSVLVGILSDKGYHIIGIDKDIYKVERVLEEKKPPIFEKELDNLFLKNSNRIEVQSNFCDVFTDGYIIFICVGTPPNTDGSVNLEYVFSVTKEIAPCLKEANHYILVVLRSTVPPGTSRNVIEILEKESGRKCGRDFGFCMNPEFLREGKAVEDFLNPPFTIIGEYDKKSGDTLENFYRDIGIKKEIYRISLESAEIFKYINNAFHAIKVAFTNEIARLCKEFKIDPTTLMEIFVKDKILNLSPYYMKPRFAFGGSCLPKDVKGILSFSPTKLPLIHASLVSNKEHIEWSLDQILSYNPKKVCVVGITFKRGTGDIRNSPYITLMRLLLEYGIDVYYYDPLVTTSENTIRMEKELKEISKKKKISKVKITSPNDVYGEFIDMLIIGSGNGIEHFDLSKFKLIIDLQGLLKKELKNMPNYKSLV